MTGPSAPIAVMAGPLPAAKRPALSTGDSAQQDGSVLSAAGAASAAGPAAATVERQAASSSSVPGIPSGGAGAPLPQAVAPLAPPSSWPDVTSRLLHFYEMAAAMSLARLASFADAKARGAAPAPALLAPSVIKFDSYWDAQVFLHLLSLYNGFSVVARTSKKEESHGRTGGGVQYFDCGAGLRDGDAHVLAKRLAALLKGSQPESGTAGRAVVETSYDKAKEREIAKGLGQGRRPLTGIVSCKQSIAAVRGPRDPDGGMAGDVYGAGLWEVTYWWDNHTHQGSRLFAHGGAKTWLTYALVEAYLLHHPAAKARQMMAAWRDLITAKFSRIVLELEIPLSAVEHAVAWYREQMGTKQPREALKPDMQRILEAAARWPAFAAMLRAYKPAGNTMTYALPDGGRIIIGKNDLLAVIVNPYVLPVLKHCSVIAADHFFDLDASYGQLGAQVVLAIDKTGQAHAVAMGLVTHQRAEMTTAVLLEIKKAALEAGVDWKPTTLLHDLNLADTNGVRAAFPSVIYDAMCLWHQFGGVMNRIAKYVTCIVEPELRQAKDARQMSEDVALTHQAFRIFSFLVLSWSTPNKDLAIVALVRVLHYVRLFPALGRYLRNPKRNNLVSSMLSLRRERVARGCNAICERLVKRARDLAAEHTRPFAMFGCMVRCMHVLIDYANFVITERIALGNRLLALAARE